MPKTAMRSFRYHKRTPEEMKERANMRGGGFDRYIKDGIKMYKVRDGKNLIRVLPPTWGDEKHPPKHYGYDIFVNYNIGVDDQSYLSLSKMLGKPDPLAEARKEAEADGDKELAKSLQPTQRICVWLIDRQAEDEGPQLWAAPFTFDKALINVSFDDDTKEVVYIDDPETGCDVRFYKEGAGLKTKYDASKMRLMKPGPIHEDQGTQDEWMAFIMENPIPDCLNFYTYDQIAAAFDGTTKSKKAADDDDERPRPRRERARAEPEDEAPFDEDEKPAPRKRPVDPDDDDEPAPRRERARARAEDEEPPKRQNIRERLASRGKPTAREPDDDGDDD